MSATSCLALWRGAKIPRKRHKATTGTTNHQQPGNCAADYDQERAFTHTIASYCEACLDSQKPAVLLVRLVELAV